MGNLRASSLFLILVAGTAIFIGLTSLSLPAVVASHFGISGTANGFMPRAFYLQFMLFFGVVPPLSLVFFTNLMLGFPRIRINLPNRAYWLAPERRAATIEFLREHTARFGSMLVIFLGYVHWLVVRANTVVPPGLPTFDFIIGLIVFAVATLLWTIALFARFR